MTCPFSGGGCAITDDGVGAGAPDPTDTVGAGVPDPTDTVGAGVLDPTDTVGAGVLDPTDTVGSAAGSSVLRRPTTNATPPTATRARMPATNIATFRDRRGACCRMGG